MVKGEVPGSIFLHLKNMVLSQHLSLCPLMLFVRRSRDGQTQSFWITPALEPRISTVLCSWIISLVGGWGRTLCQRQHCDLSTEWKREKEREAGKGLSLPQSGEGRRRTRKIHFQDFEILNCMFHKSEYINYKCHTLGLIRLDYFHNLKKNGKKKISLSFWA